VPERRTPAASPGLATRAAGAFSWRCPPPMVRVGSKPPLGPRPARGVQHFPKKPFVAKAAGCDLSTAQVLVHTYSVHFCLGRVAFKLSPFHAGFYTRIGMGSTLSVPICSRSLTLIGEPLRFPHPMK
jgi:hypothetical protein